MNIFAVNLHYVSATFNEAKAEFDAAPQHKRKGWPKGKLRKIRAETA